MKHKIKITKEYDTNDLVNLLSTAIDGCSYWCRLDYDDNEYKEAKTKLIENGNNDPCYEEILIEMLENGKSIYFIDYEEDAKHELTLKKLLKGIKKNAEERSHDCDLDNGDAITMDCIIQYALFNELVFG